ncbi:transmembrane amino acid transporter protein-domain-containing protein [Phyllosticta capitalensis]
MDVPRKQPTTWDEYDGVRAGSFESTASSRVQWDEEPDRQGRSSHENNRLDGHQLRERRSSLSMRFNSLRAAGGVNSLDNFARSWQRAAGFVEVAPVQHTFRITDDNDEVGQTRHGDIEASPGERRSLLRAAFENESRRGAPDSAVVTQDDPGTDDSQFPSVITRSSTQDRLNASRTGSLRDDNIFAIEPSLSSPFGGSYGTSFSSSLRDRLNEPSMRHAGRLFAEQQAKGSSKPDQDREPLLVKQVEEDGQIINVVVGQSTLPQTIFNSVNVLIGVGLLSLPLALKYSGWVIGLVFFAFSAVTTSYTAKLLAKCLDVDSSLITFADLAYVSFGQRARVAVSILFTLELVATCVALVVLFADTLNGLIPDVGIIGWKIVCGIILIPLGFLPLRLLSFTSVLGILCCLGIVLMVFVDGAIKPHQPGSLQEPAKTFLFPESWATVPLSFGLLMSPWGGHSVFPNIYRDMRHPYKYRRGVNITYIFTFLLDLSMAVVGLLMFGDAVRDEITSNILTTPGYPGALSVLIVAGIAIIPLTKIPLNARPIISTLELFLGLDPRSLPAANTLMGTSGLNRGILKLVVRLGTTVAFVAIAIVFPAFDRIMALLGAVACFTICIILPLAFHLQLFGKEIGRMERWGTWALIAVSSVMAVISTIFACLPKEVIEKMG